MGSDGRPGTSRLGGLALYLLLPGLALACLGPLLRAGFLRYDDPVYVTENLRVQAGLTLENLRWAFSTHFFGFYYPLTWLSHMLDCQLWGLWAPGHHLTSLALHASNAVLLFSFFRRATGSEGRSFLVAALFVLHPLHVESAAWIAERKDVLSIFFLFLALLAYLCFARRPAPGRYLVVFLLLVASLCAKPTAVTAPVLFLLLDYWPLGRVGGGEEGRAGPFPQVGWGRALLEKLPFGLLSLLFGILTMAAQRSLGAVTDLKVLPLSLRLQNAVVSTATYLAKAVFPADLAVFYPFPLEGHPPWKVLLAALLLGLLTFLALREARRRPYLFTGWFWYLATLAPMLGLIQAGRQAMADRYTYLPLVGVTAALLWALPTPAGLRVRRAWAAAGVLLLLLLGVLSFRQSRFWKDDGTLFGHALEVAPPSYLAYLNVGMARLQAGRPDEAESCLRRALELDPRCTEAQVNLAILLLQRGEEGGLDLLRAAVAQAPRSTNARLNLASALWRKGRLGETEAQLRAAVAADGESAEARRRLGALLLDPQRKGGPRPEEAVSLLEGAARISGRREPRILVQLAEAERALGEAEKARRTALEALEAAFRRKDEEAARRAQRLLEGGA